MALPGDVKIDKIGRSGAQISCCDNQIEYRDGGVVEVKGIAGRSRSAGRPRRVEFVSSTAIPRATASGALTGRSGESPLDQTQSGLPRATSLAKTQRQRRNF